VLESIFPDELESECQRLEGLASCSREHIADNTEVSENEVRIVVQPEEEDPDHPRE
jgi:hypothetical protein